MDGSTSKSKLSNSACPPPPTKSMIGLKRAGGIENFEKYSKWQTQLPPKSCAGGLANYIPDLPEGYGLPPNMKPPLIMDGHVHLQYAKLPEDISGDQWKMVNGGGQDRFQFEIVQITQADTDKFKAWFDANPKSYSAYEIEGRTFYALGGGGWYMPGHKLMGGMGVILDNNVLVKFTMPGIYADTETPRAVAEMFHEIAVKNGQ